MEMSSTILSAIEGRNMTRIVEYMLEDEQQHFLECDSDDESRDHIFMAIAPVAAALFFDLDAEALEKHNRLASPLNRIDV
jgi:hypothetical protein